MLTKYLIEELQRREGVGCGMQFRKFANHQKNATYVAE